MKKSAKWLLCVLGICDILYIAIVLICGCTDYLYAKFTFSAAAFFFNFAAMLIADGIIIGVFFLFRKEALIRFIPAMICISLIVVYVFLLIPLALTADAFWKSETESFEEFRAVDPYLDSQLELAGLTLGEILELAVEQNGDFLYSYQSSWVGISFSFKGNFEFSKESYQYIKDKLLSADEFDVVIYSSDEQNENDATGYFVFDNAVPMHESLTTVDDWQNAEIIFNDSENSFYFNLAGKIES